MWRPSMHFLWKWTRQLDSFLCHVPDDKEFLVEVIELINMLFPNITTLTTIDIIFGAFLSKNELLSFNIIATKYNVHCCY